jgi:hypothetical protein
MDDLDMASELEQQYRDAAISQTRAAAVKLAYSGQCYNCQELLDAGLFCDTFCQEDWKTRMDAKHGKNRG